MLDSGELTFTFEVDGQRQLSRRMFGLIAKLDDLKPFFEEVVEEWTDTRKAIFEAEGGFEQKKWPALQKQYARWKQRKYGDKPILERTGALKEAVTNPSVEMDATRLRITIENDYAIYHEAHRPRRRG